VSISLFSPTAYTPTLVYMIFKQHKAFLSKAFPSLGYP